MRLIIISSIIFLYCIPIIEAESLQTKTIIIASESWPDATNPDGTGTYFELSRAVYEPLGYTVEFRIVPYARSINMVKNGTADAWVASFIDEEDFAIYPRNPHARIPYSALYQKNRFPAWQGLEGFRGNTFGWIRDYDLHPYLDVIKNQYELIEVSSSIQGVRMVAAGRIDCLLDSKSELSAALDASGVNTDKLSTQPVFNQNLYLGFANTPRARELIKIWDERLDEIGSSDNIRALYSVFPSIFPF